MNKIYHDNESNLKYINDIVSCERGRMLRNIELMLRLDNIELHV
mgnify:CR=1 FL=1